MSDKEAWFVVKQSNGSCEVWSAAQIEAKQSQAQSTDLAPQWGPFKSQTEAIARRVGLIRAGKCQPV
ncbi:MULTISPECIES: hypothetical protein [Trichocoleus]|uniref:DDE transposase family protein n=1 Tax=Trichocoleus desertorum GB2-A4 TaxID=2933944 RepID=A0ABV0J8N3_9CYAN|nr:hypothetical protein [Trichocoleus sp. FACHB-46]MBD1863492.1 hypothetical protein [Trichocoleus sp. FACHB-46]